MKFVISLLIVDKNYHFYQNTDSLVCVFLGFNGSAGCFTLVKTAFSLPVYFANPSPAMISQQQQQQPQQQVQYQKRRKNIIQITDPNTGKVINDEILQTGSTKQVTPPNSGSSSSRATPVGVSQLFYDYIKLIL